MAKAKAASKAKATAKVAPAAPTLNAPKPKAHTRTAKPSEEERIAKGRRLVTEYIVQRDGMDEDLAATIVEGMEPEAVNDLIAEANTTALFGHAKAPGAVESTLPALAAPDSAAPAPGQAESVAGGTAEPAAPQPAAPEPIDFLTIPALAEDGELVSLVLEAQEKGALRTKADMEYKAAKAKIFAKYMAAGVQLKMTVDVAGVPTMPYKGKTVTLNKEMLLLKGVDPKVIKACYKETPFEDVRIGSAPAPDGRGGQ